MTEPDLIAENARECIAEIRKEGIPSDIAHYFLTCLAQCETTERVAATFNKHADKPHVDKPSEKPYRHTWLLTCLKKAQETGLLRDIDRDMPSYMRSRLFDILMNESDDYTKTMMQRMQRQIIGENAQAFIEDETTECSPAGKVGYLALLGLTGSTRECSQYPILPTLEDTPDALHALAKKHGIPQEMPLSNQQQGLVTHLRKTYSHKMPDLGARIRREALLQDTATPEEASSLRRQLAGNWTTGAVDEIAATLQEMTSKKVECDPKDVFLAATCDKDNQNPHARSLNRKQLVKLAIDDCNTLTKNTLEKIETALDAENTMNHTKYSQNPEVLRTIRQLWPNLIPNISF